MEINADIVKDLIAALGKSRVDTLRLETQDFKLTLERPAPTAQACAPAQPAAAQPCAQATEGPAAAEPEGTVVTSPIVGTFYVSSSPDKPPFVKVGQQVKKGDTLFIVESMKLMNEIASECAGTVAEIYVKNGQGVEYGQPVMRIE